MKTRTTLVAQFQNLHSSHPSAWPIVPRLLCGLAVCLLMMACGLFFYADDYWQAKDVELQKEIKLKDAYNAKLQQAVNLDGLRKQKIQAGVYVATLEKQLPGKAEMDALLSDINQAGVGRGLQFELFKPRQVIVKDYYAELPIDIKLVGTYHDIGGFTSDIAHLARIVTLNNMQLSVGKDGLLVLEAVMKTFRYLDAGEVVRSDKVEHAKKEDAKKQVVAFVPTLVNPKEFVPVAYSGKNELDPYNPGKFVTTFAKLQSQSGDLRLNSQRPREALEAYSLDDIKLVGIIQKTGVDYALLQADKVLFQLKTGHYLGKNQGVITRIGANEIEIKEVIADAAGKVVTRKAKLELQEKYQ